MEKKLKFGLIGYPLEHSLSSEIHNKFFELQGENAEYDLIELSELNNESIENFRNNYNGFNCTIPYKQKIIPFLDELDESALFYGAVNTVLNISGRLIGYNTDADGLTYALNKNSIDLNKKHVLVLGAGGVARVLTYLAAKSFAKINIYNRNLDKAQSLAEDILNNIPDSDVVAISCLTDKYDIILNGTPLGMWPNTHELPVDEDIIKSAEAVYDTIYNPTPSRLVAVARNNGVKAFNGMEMLVGQAAKAQSIWSGRKIDSNKISDVCNYALGMLRKRFRRSIILTGFMCSGKSTVGLELSKALNIPFTDIDERIKDKTDMSISDIFKNYGEKYFRNIERAELKKALNEQYQVIATGGGILTCDENIDTIKQSQAFNIFLDITTDTVIQRGQSSIDRPNLNGKSEREITELYNKRLPTYKSNADLIIDANGNLEVIIKKILNILEAK